MIEEFSMLGARFFETLDAIAKIMKHTEAAFGGVRLIHVGDVAQLPPVEDSDSNAAAKPGTPPLRRKTAKYAFQSVALWTAMQFRNYRLGHCWRFPWASRLGQFLFELRVATSLHDALYAEIKALSQQSEVSLDDAVTLCCNNQIARQMSQKALNKLPGADSVFFAVDRHGPGGTDVHCCTLSDEKLGKTMVTGAPLSLTRSRTAGLCSTALHKLLCCGCVLVLKFYAPASYMTK